MVARKAHKLSAGLLLAQWRHRFTGGRLLRGSFRPAPPVISPSALASPVLRTLPYCVRLAETDRERRAAFRLRFRVFNLEMNEGLESSYQTGEDTDGFDALCDHLIVHHEPSDEIVGTYRLQTGITASRNLGYYSAREFQFKPYEHLRAQIVELGRACIHPDHRKYEVLILLWKGIARYAMARNARYLIGCSSIQGQDVALGSAMYEKLRPMLVPEGLRTVPQSSHAFPLSEANADVHPPKLLRTYLTVGARICGPPAIDRDFGTIDFLTLMDLNNLSPAVRSRFMET